ncbi:Tat pathway signal sequence domain protein [Brachybacterium sp. JHP9]|uniref:Tat pathway signal sequence domain protein n=1 Tax=Brachybacterium equifaecis TaxID=2910770 RepID=A0ABT0QZD9_9MICO|nr:Tat pathway signal sequence domain protein [Brachybacterium equifaecis]MCL6422889.1 Tat pathway signal sequence domain protein [Brachybacterium equifaecis]
MRQPLTPHHDRFPAIGRRTLLLGAFSATTLACAVPAQALPGSPQPSRRGRPGLASALDFLETMTTAGRSAEGPTLPQSYADQLGLFSTAFVYDAALALLAALASGEEHLARRIADGLVFAQTHDPVHRDGRLRQGYNVAPFTFYDGVRNEHGLELPDGTANIGWQFGFLGTAVGDMAWPGIALVQAYRATGDAGYRAAAQRIGEWILARAVNSGALGGFSFGVSASDQPIPNVSTEHNIDCVSLFTLLSAVDPSPRWDAAAEHARTFVERMWEPAGGFFYTGSNDGIVINRAPLPLDPQTWSWLALQDPRYAGALDWAATALAVTDTPQSPNSQLPAGTAFSGVTFSSASLTSTAVYNGLAVDPNGVWFEGSAQLALALADRAMPRDRARANALLREMRRAQTALGAGQTVSGVELEAGGLVAASSPIDSGFGFGYFQVQHVGATAWYVMAERGANPMVPGGLD